MGITFKLVQIVEYCGTIKSLPIVRQSLFVHNLIVTLLTIAVKV